MTRRRGFGLRPRLLAALVFTSVVTLAVAALALLPPLQSRLTDQAASDLENATPADAPLFQNASRRSSAARAPVARRAPQPAERGPPEPHLHAAPAHRRARDRRRLGARRTADRRHRLRGQPASAQRDPDARSATRGAHVRHNDQVIVVQPIDVPASLSLNRRGSDRSPSPAGDFVLVTQKQLTDVTTAVHQVRTAFLAAAAVGLLVAVLLGIGLATTIGRRARPPARRGGACRRGGHRCTDSRATTAATRSATSPAPWPRCSASCAARRRRGARSSRPPRTSCARR